jgi:N6-L-threonylcarbamoyladenine synthase
LTKPVYILAIESSCDDTGAAVLCNDKILANIVFTQAIHAKHGGVVPELASRQHLKQISLTVQEAIKVSGIERSQLDAIAYTQGPGLLGSLLVGSSFAKGMAMGLNIPLIGVNHMQAHVLAHFIQDERQQKPEFPFLCLTVSGGHTQLVKVSSPAELVIIGQTLDDAAGEAFDKAAKIMGLSYPGGPAIDKLGQNGNPKRFEFAKPQIPGYDFSFSGFKTSFLYFINEQKKNQPNFIEENLSDLCASLQHSITQILLKKFLKAADDLNIHHLALSGGVAANSYLRETLLKEASNRNKQVYIPAFEFCTDNAGMIGIAGYLKYLNNDFTSLSEPTQARMGFGK